MIYVYSITTPANTLASAKLKTVLPLPISKISEVSLQFPSGAVGYHHVQINRGLHQLWPLNPDGDFATSGETVHWFEDYDLDQPPLQLEAYTWNLDTTYDHTVTIRIVTTPISGRVDLAAEVAQLVTAQAAAAAPAAAAPPAAPTPAAAEQPAAQAPATAQPPGVTPVYPGTHSMTVSAATEEQVRADTLRQYPTARIVAVERVGLMSDPATAAKLGIQPYANVAPWNVTYWWYVWFEVSQEQLATPFQTPTQAAAPRPTPPAPAPTPAATPTPTPAPAAARAPAPTPAAAPAPTPAPTQPARGRVLGPIGPKPPKGGYYGPK